MRAVFLLAVLALTACAPLPGVAGGPRAATAPRVAARAAWARVVPAGKVPVAIAAPARAKAQLAADKASERRDIDYFALPEAPVGMQLGDAWVLSFLGTGKTDGDVNVELRALVAGADVGVTMNYSGPTTLGRAPFPAPAPQAAGSRWELLTGLPGDQVVSAYGDYLDALAPYLRQRHGAQPFAFDDGPLVFALHEGEEVVAFVFTNQGNKLILGERKYADVQSVVAVTPAGAIAVAYTLIGWNAKTAGPGAAPTWTTEVHERFGTFAWCGDGPSGRK